MYASRLDIRLHSTALIVHNDTDLGGCITPTDYGAAMVLNLLVLSVLDNIVRLA